MGWLPWTRDDPLKEIDPSLRQFLESSTPKEYKPAEPTKQSSGWHVPTFRSMLGLDEEPESPYRPVTKSQEEKLASSEEAEQRPLPRESLFQDGRYAHLWKTYRPLAETAEAGKSDQEKLTDIVSAFKERNAELGRAAMENCAMEQMAIHDCFSTGGIAARMTMCRSENKALEKCIGMQTKFLRALGYLTLFERGQEESEKIQMHADTLYHRMLDQEKVLEDARQRGQPLPALEPVIKTPVATENNEVSEDKAAEDGYRPQRAPMKLESLPKHLQDKYTEQVLKDKEGPELELAKRQLEQDLAWQQEVFQRFDNRYMDERRERVARQEVGLERFSDKIKRYFDLRDWSQFDEMERQRKEEEQKLSEKSAT